MSLFQFLFPPTFFMIIGLFSEAQTSPNKFFVPKISVKMALSGDIDDTFQFAGPLGSQLLGAGEKPESVCENKSSFQQVIHAKEKSVQIWMPLKCTANGQSFEFQPYRFFVNMKTPEKVIVLPVLSEKFRKISVTLTDLQIKDKPNQK